MQIIEEERSDMVLFAGDITGDGSCGRGYQNACKTLLCFLEINKIPSMIISGNHDLVENYQDLLQFVSQLQYCSDISDKYLEVDGVRVLGVSFEGTKSKTKLNTLLDNHKDKEIDVILAHSEIKRRIRLYDVNAKVICTGHYDRKMFALRDRFFISLDNDSHEVSYATMEYLSPQDLNIEYKVRHDETTTLSLTESIKNGIPNPVANHVIKVNGNPALDLNKIEKYSDQSLRKESGESLSYLKYLRGSNLKNVYNSMLKIKSKEALGTADLIYNVLKGQQITPTYKTSSVFVKDYLG